MTPVCEILFDNRALMGMTGSGLFVVPVRRLGHLGKPFGELADPALPPFHRGAGPVVGLPGPPRCLSAGTGR
jgi:hypothetical protein